jgi:hypothetical protein
MVVSKTLWKSHSRGHRKKKKKPTDQNKKLELQFVLQNVGHKEKRKEVRQT